MLTGKRKDLYIALFFLVVQVLVVFRNLAVGYHYFFWLCDFVPIVYFFGFLFRRYQFVRGVLSFAFFPQLIYLIYFISRIVFAFVWGRGGVFEMGAFYIIASLFMHFSSFIALGFICRDKIESKSLLYSLVFIVFTWILVVLFTDPLLNVNYVYSGSIYFGVGSWFFIVWFLLAIVFVSYPTYLFQKWFCSKIKK